MKTPLNPLHNKNPMKAITFLLCRSLRASSVAVVLAATFACTASSSGQVLFSDTFTATNSNMNVYTGGGQSGSLTTPIGYTFTGAVWQTQIVSNNAQLISNGNTASFSLANNFTNAVQLTINSTFLLPQATAWIKFGSGANANYNAAGGAAFAVDGSSDVYLFDGASSVATFNDILLASNTLQIELISSANYNGTGTVAINAWLNSVQLDLNGLSAGNTYTTASGFTQNYITFAQFSPGFQSWTVNDWDVAVVPEPSTYALLVLSAAGVAAHVARRRRLR
jgi:hypothetical protein